MATPRDNRWSVSTTNRDKARTSFTTWIDYLFWNNWGVNQIVEDENGEAISIYADSGYEEIANNTDRTQRTPI